MMRSNGEVFFSGKTNIDLNPLGPISEFRMAYPAKTTIKH